METVTLFQLVNNREVVEDVTLARESAERYAEGAARINPHEPLRIVPLVVRLNPNPTPFAQRR